MEKDRYLLHRSYKNKIDNKRKAEVTYDERDAYNEYQRLSKKYQRLLKGDQGAEDSRRGSPAGKYARESMGKDKYELTKAYWYKLRTNRHEEINDDERAAGTEYQRLSKSYGNTEVSSQKIGAEKTDYPDESRPEAPSFPDDQRSQTTLPQNIEKIHTEDMISAEDHHRRTEQHQSAAGKYAREIMGEDKFLLYISYSNKIDNKSHIEITYEEMAANAEYHHLSESYRDGEDMINGYTQE